MRPIAVLLAALGPITACGRVPAEARAVVLLTLDTTRADRIGCYGNPSIETPALGSVAREGVLFLNASAAAPITLPSHSSIMTGRYPASHGVRNNGSFVLAGSERTLAEVFRSRGYETAAFIAAFPLASVFGLGQGFDVYDQRLEPPRERAGGGPAGYPREERNAAEVNAAALPWLARQKGKRFFLWVHYFDPHAPYDPPPPFAKRYASNPYDGEIAFMDSRIGELLSKLADVADPQSTVLAIVGDHGEGLGEHGESFHGLFIYEPTIRVPFLLRAPGRLPAGARVADPVSVVDIFPTLLDLAGLAGETGKGPRIGGTDLVPLVVSGGRRRTEDSPVLLESLLPRVEFGWSELRGIRSGHWKYIQAPRPELYDLTADPLEKRNLLGREGSVREGVIEGPPEAASSAASLAATLKARLDASLSLAGASAPREGIPSALDEQAIAKLRSLGYLQGGPGRLPPPPSETDPKDMIGVYEGLNQVWSLLLREDSAGAIAACRALLARDPNNPRIQWRLGEALLMAGRYDELEAFLKPLLVGGPSYYWAPGLLAQSHQSRGDLEGALALYRMALLKDPNTSETRIDITKLLQRMGRFEAALEEARQVLALAPDHFAALQLAAECQERLGEVEPAVALRKKILEQRPDDPAALAALGRALFDARRFDESRPHFERLASIAPSNPEGPLFLGAIKVLEGKYAEALPLLRRASQAAPDDRLTRYWLGTALLMSHDFSGAEAQLVPLIQNHPRAFEGYRAVGLLRMEQGRREEAIAAFHRALALKPDDEPSRMALRKLGVGS